MFTSVLALAAAALAVAVVVGWLLRGRSETVDGLLVATSDAALWIAFLVAGTAMAGSLYFSEVADFIPCRLCWFQRICMYPLALLTLLAALANDYRIARYLLPLPVIGAGFSVYHLLVENGVVHETQGCRISAPGGCAIKWIDEFGYVTIPTLALTGFALVFAFLLLAAFEPGLPSEVE